MEAIEQAGHSGKIDLGMDVAASEFWVPETKMYDLDFKTQPNDGSKCINEDQLIGFYK